MSASQADVVIAVMNLASGACGEEDFAAWLAQKDVTKRAALKAKHA
ncbi:MAG TPA: hypothetical protein VKX25_07165 [Bryobacteraceae bacterium]|jgi:hypothetical protein|nr:hypothetical protein [Bryobacteraceae bacterium]